MSSQSEKAVVISGRNYSFVAYRINQYLHPLANLKQKGIKQCLEIFTIPMI
jgi:hypothetical protein